MRRGRTAGAQSFAGVLGIGFLLLVSLVFSAAITAIGMAVPSAVTFTISHLVIAALFAGFYKIVPDVKLQWSDVTLAGCDQLIVVYGWQALDGTVFCAYRFRVELWRRWFASCRVAMGILLGADIFLGR